MSKPEIVLLMEKLGFLLYQIGNEWHGNCPYCNDPQGEDRFMVFSDGNSYCRICEKWWSPSKFKSEFFTQNDSSLILQSLRSIPEKRESNLRVLPCIYPSLEWSQQAEYLVNHIAQSPHDHKWGRNELGRRDIHFQTAANWTVRYVPQDYYFPGYKFGLKREYVWIPQGLLVAYYYEVYGELRCIKMKVRREKYQDKLPKYVEISGSVNAPMVFGYNTSKIALIVESELDAIRCMQEASSYIWCVAIGGASKPIDEETDELLQTAPFILWSMDQDEAGKKRYISWRKKYTHLRAWPADNAKSVGDMSFETILPWVKKSLNKYGCFFVNLL